MIARRALVGLLGLALVSGCSTPPTTPAPAVSVASSSREEGDLLASRGDYGGAVAKYRAALEATPNDVALRFALGSALSQLGRHAETTEQFRWVVQHGAPGQQEVVMARQWLAGPQRGSGAGTSSGRQAVTMSPAWNVFGSPVACMAAQLPISQAAVADCLTKILPFIAVKSYERVLNRKRPVSTSSNVRRSSLRLDFWK